MSTEASVEHVVSTCHSTRAGLQLTNLQSRPADPISMAGNSGDWMQAKALVRALLHSKSTKLGLQLKHSLHSVQS